MILFYSLKIPLGEMNLSIKYSEHRVRQYHIYRFYNTNAY